MSNVACYRLGTMLNLEIQKGKEDMKTLKFQKYIRGTAKCMKILSIATKGCVQLTSNDTYFANIWFGSLKTAEEGMFAEVNYCGSAKTIHKGFVKPHENF